MMKVYGRSRASLTIHTIQRAYPRPAPRNISEETSLLIGLRRAEDDPYFVPSKHIYKTDRTSEIEFHPWSSGTCATSKPS